MNGRPRRPTLLLAVWLVLGAAACGAPEEASRAAPGVTGNEIVLGSSAALGGHAGFLGTQYLHGSLACFREINAAGGIHGRKIRVISYDDAYDPPRTVANTTRLIAEDRVFALFDYVGTPTSVQIIDTQVVPSPHGDDQATVRAYREAVRAHFPDDPPNYVALEGYLNAKVLAAAHLGAGRDLTRQSLTDALEGMQGFDAGIGKLVSFGRMDHQGLDEIYYSRMSADGSFRTFTP